MNGNNIGRAALLLTASLALGAGMTACSRDYTVAYVYAGSAQTGKISAFGIDYQSGTLNQLDGSPFGTGSGSTDTNIVAMVAAPNSKEIYAIDNKSSHVEPYSVGTDGKLYAQGEKSTNGSFPTAAAIDPSGAFLYVTYTYQQGYTTASPGPGGVSIFPINSDGSLGTPTQQVVGNNPVGIVVSALNHFVYVVDAETVNGQQTGEILCFSQNTSTGALTPLSNTNITTVNGNTVATGVAVGVQPSAIAEEPKAGTVYVTDQQNNLIYAFGVNGSGAAAGAGTLYALNGSPYATGLLPTSITIDPRGKYLYVSNFSANSVSAFQIGQVTGLSTLTGVTGSAAAQVGTEPVAITIEPALGKYMFVANRLSNQISGVQINTDTGGLTNIQNTPFDTQPLPSAVVSVANGQHATQLITP